MDKVFLKIAFLCVKIKHKCVFMHDIFDTKNTLLLKSLSEIFRKAYIISNNVYQPGV